MVLPIYKRLPLMLALLPATLGTVAFVATLWPFLAREDRELYREAVEFEWDFVRPRNFVAFLLGKRSIE